MAWTAFPPALRGQHRHLPAGYWEELGDYATAGIVFIGALLAYLWQNAKPSTLLMGDAGSRAMGFFLAVLASRAATPSPSCWPRWCSLWTAAWAS